MQKRKEALQSSANRGSKFGIGALVFCAFLAALSIVLGKYLAFPVGPILRFSFENLPVIMGGMLFGPVAGLLIGIVADLVGCVLVGYTINPIVTAGAAAIGLCSGVLYRVCARLSGLVRVLISVIVSHLIGSVLIKTWGLAAFYEMPCALLLLWRALNYAVVGAAECALLYYLLSARAISSRIVRLKR